MAVARATDQRRVRPEDTGVGEKLFPAGVWDQLAAAIDESQLRFRPDGKPFTQRTRNGETDASRYVVYIDAQAVRERLDAVVPGQWLTKLELLPVLGADGDGTEEPGERVSFICRLTICGVEREDVGSGRNYKAAASDAFKRAAQRFGIGASLHQVPSIVVPVELTDGPRQRVRRALVPPLELYRRALSAREER